MEDEKDLTQDVVQEEQPKESLVDLLKRLTAENALPDLEKYKEVWIRELGDRAVFFCKKNVIWWMLECAYNEEGRITELRQGKLGKSAPWDEMRTIHGTSKEQFLAAFKRIK